MASDPFGAPKLNSHELQFAFLRHDGEWNGAKGKRRDKFDIIAEILLFCERQKTKTSKMYNANYTQLKNHMETLLLRVYLHKTATSIRQPKKAIGS